MSGGTRTRREVSGTHGQRWITSQFAGGWAVACSATHVVSISYELYSDVWWWDLFVHGACGFGVAAVLYVVAPRAFDSSASLFVVLPLLVTVLGVGYEAAERLFMDFWHHWPQWFYVVDTVGDVLADYLGGLVFGVLAFVDDGVATRRS
jgi:hypothetical protein